MKQNEIYGQLIILESAPDSKKSNDLIAVSCSCGIKKFVRKRSLTAKHKPTQSCGCLNRIACGNASKLVNTKHGQSGKNGSKLYRVWAAMLGRCRTANDQSYPNYGGRGITVTEAWNDFTVFQKWAIKAGYVTGLSIERKDVYMDYSPQNCTWIPVSDQSYNKTNTLYLTCFGETKSVALWIKDERCCVKNWNTLKQRLNLGWGDERAITMPVRRQDNGIDRDKICVRSGAV